MRPFSLFAILFFVFVSLVFNSGCGKGNSVEVKKVNPDSPVEINGEGPDDEALKPKVTITPDYTYVAYIREDSAPHMFFDESGDAQGFYVELERAVLKQMGHDNYRFEGFVDVGPMLHELKEGTAHSALAAPRTSDFEKIFNLSDTYMTIDFVCFVRNGYDSLEGSTRASLIESLSGKNIGVQARSQIYDLFRARKDINLIEYSTSTIALKKLAEGEVDVVPDVRQIGEYYSELNNWNISPYGPVLASIEAVTAFSRAVNKDFVERYNKALAEIKRNGTFDILYKELFVKGKTELE